MIVNKNNLENIATNSNKQIENTNTNNYIINLLSNIIVDLENKQNKTYNDNISCSLNIEFFYKLYKIFIQTTNEMSVFMKKYTEIVVKFIRLLVIYLIEKYYYNFNDIDFILKSSKDIETFNFFVDFNNLKKYLNCFKQKENKPATRFGVYYLILLLIYINFGPISWFLIRVLTDAQNWMEHTLDTMTVLPLPFIH